jgi:ribonuclease P protein component
MTSLSPMTLQREKRLRKRRDYLRVQRFGSRYFGRYIVAVAERCKIGENGRVGFTVPKKVGAAHVRNKIKRRLRHIVRNNPNLFFERTLVIVARDNASNASFTDLVSDVVDACRKIRDRRAGDARSRSWARKVS